MAELDTAMAAPKVVALGRPVSNPGQPRTEVDVIANAGHAWIEVKATSRFGLASSTWEAIEKQALLLTLLARERPPPSLHSFIPRNNNKTPSTGL
jgi:hypothetical protein